MLATAEQLVFDWAHAHPDSHYRPLVAVSEDWDGRRDGPGGDRARSAGARHRLRQRVRGPGARGALGAGTLLLRAAEEHLAERGAHTLYSWVMDEPRNRAWAEKRGYAPSRSAYFLRLDLAAVELPPLQGAARRAGVELLTAEDFAADPRVLFELDAVIDRRRAE
ncbi:N-acetyltransferase [Streptomyces narbonensis]